MNDVRCNRGRWYQDLMLRLMTMLSLLLLLVLLLLLLLLLLRCHAAFTTA